ncbi:MAG: hypothetical protein A2977_03590 [Alphaproteobacteria bacterium RIFCSPLOWO2_01_FULL_45_8]|nr:MAG: hypothetical protein A2065_01510 [Alphaproteobacteria bacterium GWB1_45_5]OFW76621.1 MAG: hypothetical protein A3K20_00360 [Alphaproteobacteria bacterium GWA1_45_9]OFW89705.1 MAG: hypothetical protein A2621_02250 [Alphaproteobacteria bacterium RIFCSPHIGHO2_01_FULL_41_14]OFW96113.1 MAG: hypothetical protein A2977_03590 [Alphaproteobacteria bacterium RIFCSPLOWO2_01_FULL_45_8]HCI49150.1 hypothetical protein [Holosporales bacterium]
MTLCKVGFRQAAWATHPIPIRLPYKRPFLNPENNPVIASPQLFISLLILLLFFFHCTPFPKKVKVGKGQQLTTRQFLKKEKTPP